MAILLYIILSSFFFCEGSAVEFEGTRWQMGIRRNPLANGNSKEPVGKWEFEGTVVGKSASPSVAKL